MDQFPYHGKKESHHHKEIVVSCECYSDPENKLAQTGSHENRPSANSEKNGKEYIVHDFLQKTKYCMCL